MPAIRRQRAGPGAQSGALNPARGCARNLQGATGPTTGEGPPPRCCRPLKTHSASLGH